MGYTQAYGSYDLREAKLKENEKVVGKGATLYKPITAELFSEHLYGHAGIGIVPINEKSQAQWGAIDIDEYPVDFLAMSRNIRDNDMPLIPCRTKSGGAHLFLFLKEFVEAKLVQKKLKEMASFLGYGSMEIFPKQTELLAERGDAGSWINLPYFEAHKTTRYAYNDSGEQIDLLAFLELAVKKKLDRLQLEKLKFTIKEELPGGPPCLQYLIKHGFPEGSRNSGLLNLAVYAKKAHGDKWQPKLEEYNDKYMDPPLPSVEVLSVMKSASRKEYAYTCKSQPIQAFCNAAVCRTCVHGVGGANLGMPKPGTLTKLNTVPPLWFVDVETEEGDKRVELTTEQLQSSVFYQRALMEAANLMPWVMKRETWNPIICALLEDVNVVEVPVEVTPRGHLFESLETFCMSKMAAKNVDEILLGKPWHHANEIHFRFRDFRDWLDRLRIKYERHQLMAVIRDVKGYRPQFHNIKGKGANCMVISLEAFTYQKESFEEPEQPEEVI